MIDIHCHILADVDDGPRSWDVAEQMCHMALADGIEHIVATPHANSCYEYDREHLTSLLQSFRKRVGPKPRLSLGCDFHLSYENLQDIAAFPRRYTIDGTQYFLAEPSNYSIPPQIDDSFTKLRTLGLTPIITHPERNPILQQTPERILRWVELGCIIQVTGSVLTGSWGEAAWRTAQWLLKRDAVHVLASDAHDLKRRPPLLSAARDAASEICGDKVAHSLVYDNPRAIIAGQVLPYFPEPVITS